VDKDKEKAEGGSQETNVSITVIITVIMVRWSRYSKNKKLIGFGVAKANYHLSKLVNKAQ